MPQDSIRQALAIRDGRIVAVGSDAEIRPMIGEKTTVINLQGKTVVPGFIEEHVHATDVASALLGTPYAVLSSIAEVQDWIRRYAATVPAGTWIVVPRNDITRLAERRHPTVAELDAACTTHPVAFNAARKWVLNTPGLSGGRRRQGRDQGAGRASAAGRGRQSAHDRRRRHRRGRLPAVAQGLLRPVPARGHGFAATGLDALEKVLHVYNEVGITSINERGGQSPDSGSLSHPSRARPPDDASRRSPFWRTCAMPTTCGVSCASSA